MITISQIARIRDSKVVKNIADFGRQSLRKIAEATGLSKDSVSRSLKSQKKRDKYPESHLWETNEGQDWLNMMFCATIYEFGLKGGNGAERISAFFNRIRVNTHIGVSPTAIRTKLRKIEELAAEYQECQEKKQSHSGRKMRDTIGTGDETFFKERVMLVLLDLPSGYLILEDEAKDRAFDTWESRAKIRLEQLGLKVRHFISDRGKSLIKLAVDGFGCASGADMFHAQYEISKSLGRALHAKFGQALKKLKEAEAKLKSMKEKGISADKTEEQESLVKECQKNLESVEKGKKEYKKTQQAVSGAVHAFSLKDNKAQTSGHVESCLENEVKRFEKIAEEQSIKDKKNKADTFRLQIKDIASVIDAWWLWTKESLAEYDAGQEVRNWLLHVLLPVLYWHNQREKTQNPELKKEYEAAWKKALDFLNSHPLTSTISKNEMEKWQSWGEWACNNFHRTSSAVEGRNGYLSQCHHNGRGMTRQRQKALTAIHNYDTKRRDGTTPAQRLFGVEFEDMFEWIFDQMGDIPLPRKARQPAVKNPFNIKGVAG